MGHWGGLRGWLGVPNTKARNERLEDFVHSNYGFFCVLSIFVVQKSGTLLDKSLICGARNVPPTTNIPAAFGDCAGWLRGAVGSNCACAAVGCCPSIADYTNRHRAQTNRCATHPRAVVANRHADDRANDDPK